MKKSLKKRMIIIKRWWIKNCEEDKDHKEEKIIKI